MADPIEGPDPVARAARVLRLLLLRARERPAAASSAHGFVGRSGGERERERESGESAAEKNRERIRWLLL